VKSVLGERRGSNGRNEKQVVTARIATIHTLMQA